MTSPATKSVPNTTSEAMLCLDAALEEFERRWSVERLKEPSIDDCLCEFGLTESPSAVVEMIRIEVDRKCALGLDVQLREYLLRFPNLTTHPQLVFSLAFEDYRARSSRGLDCPPSRWSWIAGIESASWFRALLARESSGRQRRSNALGSASERAASGGRQAFGVEQHADSGRLDEHRAETLPTVPQVGDRLGDFELLELLGEGSFSRVFLARQTSLDGRRVAVKVVSRPMQEPANLARLLHSGIIPLYSYHRVDPYWVLCMPYAGSVTLADWMKVQPAASSRTGQSLVMTVVSAKRRVSKGEIDSANLGPETLRKVDRALSRAPLTTAAQPLDQVEAFDASRLVLWFYRRLSAALAHAHRRGVIHGDLKPANVLVCNDGEPALIDFNLSHAGDESSRSWVGGTLPYMAPEQLRGLCGQRSVVGPAADVYALAAVIYELAEGHLPFPSPRSSKTADIEAALDARTHAAPPTFGSRVTPGLAAIFRKSFAFDPTQRYPTAIELAEDIGREARNEPLRHTAEGFWRSRVPKFARRHPRLCSASTALVFGLFCLAASWFAIGNYRDRAWRLTAVETFAAFQQHSDRAVVAALVDRPEGQQSRWGLARLAFEHSPDAMSSNDLKRSAYQYLTFEEQARLEEQIFLVAILTMQDQLRAAVLAPERCDREAIQESLRVIRGLPEWAQQSRSLWTVRSQLAELPRAVEFGVSSPTEKEPVATRRIDRLCCAIGLVAQERYAEALTYLDQPQLAESEGVAYWLTMGRTHLGLGALPDAVLSFTLGIGLRPDLAVSYLNRGNAQFRLGKFVSARDDFSRAIEIEPDLVAAFVNRSFCHTALGEHQRALADLDAALTIAPDSNRLLFMRSRALKPLGRDGEATESFTRARASKPASVEDWVALALAWLPEHPQNAVDALRLAEEQRGAHTMILQSLAHVYAEHLHDPAKATAILDRLLTYQPHFLKALAGRGVLQARAGQLDAALADARRIESQGGQLPAEIEYQLACIYALLCPMQETLAETGLQKLADAIRRGYGANLLDTDADLANLRQHNSFRALRQTSQLFRR